MPWKMDMISTEEDEQPILARKKKKEENKAELRDDGTCFME